MTENQKKKFSIKEFINTPTVPLKVTYSKLFWLFIGGSLIGVVLEGLFCLVMKGAWETHVITIWGPFCIIYGMGAAGFYVAAAALQKQNMIVKFIAIAVVGDLVEIFCSVILQFGMHMKAWDYSGQRFNFQGRISLVMTLAWGLLGTLYIYLAVPRLEKLFEKMQGKAWKIVCIAFTVFMIVNFIVTLTCMVRWTQRHRNIETNNRFLEFVDKKYDDDRMGTRFCEWSFIDSHDKNT